MGLVMSVRDSEHEDESEYTKADKKDNTVEIVVVFNPGLRFAGQVGGPPSADAGAQFVTPSAHFTDSTLTPLCIVCQSSRHCS